MICMGNGRPGIIKEVTDRCNFINLYIITCNVDICRRRFQRFMHESLS